MVVKLDDWGCGWSEHRNPPSYFLDTPRPVILRVKKVANTPGALIVHEGSGFAGLNHEDPIDATGHEVFRQRVRLKKGIKHKSQK